MTISGFRDHYLLSYVTIDKFRLEDLLLDIQMMQKGHERKKTRQHRLINQTM